MHDGDPAVNALQVGLAIALASMQAVNQPTVGRMQVALAVAQAGFVAEIVGLGAGAALA